MRKDGKLFCWIILIITVAVLLALDLWLKAWASANLLGEHRSLISGFLGLTYFRNTGAAFGLFSGVNAARWILSILKIVIITGLIWFYNKIPLEKLYWSIRVPIILIIAGGLGNLVDRAWLGSVRDMLVFEFVNFPIFNLADVYVVVGCFVGLFIMLFVVKEFS
jgi:signal peptidase II